MKYDVKFATLQENDATMDLVHRNVGRDPNSYCVLDVMRTAVWRCETFEEASQIEARVRGALAYTLVVQPATLVVQPAPPVSRGGLPTS